MGVQFNSAVQGGAAGATASLVKASFDGAGTYSASVTLNAGGTISTQTSQGSYTVQSNGALTLNSSEPQGAVSADGNVFALSFVGSGEAPQILVAVRSSH